LAQLARRGLQVSFHDPFVTRLRSHQLNLRRSALTSANLAAADLVVLLTPHSSYDLEKVRRHARLVFDARNVLGSRGDDAVVTL
jgi:UDP-N-acetyl-D-glucosamine dehydrogenase